MKKHVFILMMLLALPARAAEVKPAIIVLPFDAGVERKFQPLAKGLPDVVTACFTAADANADILERAALPAIAGEQTMGFDASKFREIKGATHVLRGTLATQDAGFIVTLMLYDLASTKLVASAEASGGAGEVTDIVCKGVKDLSGKIATLKPQEASPGAADAAAQEQGRLMIEGLSAYYSGAYESALAPFLKLVRLEPKNAAALYWLAKCHAGADMTEAAAAEFRQFLAKFPQDARAAEVRELLKAEEGKAHEE